MDSALRPPGENWENYPSQEGFVSEAKSSIRLLFTVYLLSPHIILLSTAFLDQNVPKYLQEMLKKPRKPRRGVGFYKGRIGSFANRSDRDSVRGQDEGFTYVKAQTFPCFCTMKRALCRDFGKVDPCSLPNVRLKAVILSK